MDFSPKHTQLATPRSCRLVQSGTFAENRERYMAQSKLTKNGVRADVPSFNEARKINEGN